jgi:hypothetical protein
MQNIFHLENKKEGGGGMMKQEVSPAGQLRIGNTIEIQFYIVI